METFDVAAKILLVGLPGVGKSNLMYQFSDNVFFSEYNSTVGVEFKPKVVQHGDRKIKLQIWDIAGKEKLRAILQSYYKGAAVVVIVFDITNEESFKKVPEIVSSAREMADEGTRFILVGNKLDLSEERVVKFYEAKTLAQDLGMLYLEASAKDGLGVETIFMEAAGLVLSSQAKKTEDE